MQQQKNKVPTDKSNESCAKLFWRNYITYKRKTQ